MPPTISTRELLRLRLSAQRIEPAERLTLVDVARHFLATQAQDFIQGGWALGLRAPGSRLSDLTGALDRGEIVRAAPFRGTLHFMPASELAWVLGVTAERTIASAATRQAALGLDDATLARARDVTERALADRTAHTRDEYFTVLREAGIDPSGQRGYHVIWYLAQTGVVLWGPAKGTQQGLVLSEEWTPHPRRLEGDEALGELALRYFSAHGPATVRDFAWWTKLTLTAARRGIEVARPELTELDHAGTTLLARTEELDRASGRRLGTRVHALPGFDEYLLGYQDRSAALAEEHFTRIVPGMNGIFLPMIVLRGEIVGTWKRAERAASVTVEPEPFIELDDRQRAAFARSTAEFARFRRG